MVGEGEWINCSVSPQVMGSCSALGKGRLRFTLQQVCFSFEVCCSERDLQNLFSTEKWAEIFTDG